jgi:ubiquitin C-terminal hydrolase
MKGLDNLGNTCYFNCALQCLLQVPQLSNLLILREYQGPCEFTKEYQETVRRVWLNTGTESPRKLLKCFRERFPQFNNSDQQDSQEAFLCLLDMLDTSLSNSYIRRVFYGKLAQETICKSETSRRFEDSPVIILYPPSGGKLEDMLAHHQKWSVIENFEDSKGSTHHVATTRTFFWNLPKVLTISINRKLMVTVPETLTVPSNEGDGKFSLFATCKHHGSNHSGHYIAYTKHRGQWYIKNDGLCMPIAFPTNDYHYFLLYKRVNSSH